MATAELTDARRNGYSPGETGVDNVGHFCVPPIASTQASTDADTFLVEQAFDATPGDEHFFQAAEQSEIQRIPMGFGSQRMLIFGTGVVVALAIGILAYVFWSSGGEKKEMETAEAAPAVQPVAPVQVAPRSQELLSGPTAIAWPDGPTSGFLGSSAQIAAAAPAGNTETRQTAPATQDRDIVFLQRPGVNIRSTPSANGPVLGTAPKGTRFNVAKRDGDWIQVEGNRIKGWINFQFLGPNEP
jgi:hypothetical protein